MSSTKRFAGPRRSRPNVKGKGVLLGNGTKVGSKVFRPIKKILSPILYGSEPCSFELGFG